MRARARARTSRPWALRRCVWRLRGGVPPAPRVALSSEPPRPLRAAPAHQLDPRPPARPPLLQPPAGVGLLDQQNSFIGKVLLHVCVFAILLVRTSSDLDKYKVGAARARAPALAARDVQGGTEACMNVRAPAPCSLTPRPSATLGPPVQNLIDEATFYDKQWNATWEGQERPSDN